MLGTYNQGLVLLSLLVAMMASYTALDLASRITASTGAAAVAWLLGGAFAMGTGIWSMHFIGMLAFDLPIAMSYDIPITVGSMGIAIVVSGFALLIATRQTLSHWRLAAAGVLMGLGICSMHYAGMAAMEVLPAIRYDALLFLASVAVAIAAATAALWIAFQLRTNGRRRILARMGSAVIMGGAIVGMHYTGMAAANFAPGSICLGGPLATNGWMAATIAIITFLILCGTLSLSVLDARMESKTAQMASWLQSANAELQRLVLHDSLTKLPNRLLLEDRLQQAVEACRRHGGRCAVLFVDLDRFKTLNDSLGHYAGDRVLRTIADRLRAAVREEDTVSRLGGDEFVILLRNVSRPEDAGETAAKIMSTLSRVIPFDGLDLRVGSSIGISLFPEHGQDATRLIASADAAMYHVKKSGRANVAYFSEDMNTFSPEQLVLESELRTAVERQQLILHYQPKVDLHTGRITGVEALVRWKHPERGLVPPAEFIPFAEETGLIIPIGNWVLREACVQNKAWQRRGLPDLVMAVNISGLQFQQADLVQTVSEVLEESGLDPSLLELEITESVVMHNAPQAIVMLEELHRMGVGLSIDDFGTGYSSLNYLKRFPIQKLKIDQSFIADLSVDADDAAIVQAIMAMAHGLRLGIVAEGVEREDQLQFLRGLGQGEYQGFLFSQAVPAADVERRLLAQPSSVVVTGN
ncbi:putative signaling protein [Usitatibacter rugosus]|uniref:Putative signaling protein n=1 Tax=Usitatibacter rugosus TaxID=2732067 RepID=A0A6M4GUH0_9PROT|nr:EAL domain-containing protein [Usitatibacter rugosus]QJR10960.1 putative signaling protein [Usitatibacter rugosus]